jgi:hypothetical protein
VSNRAKCLSWVEGGHFETTHAWTDLAASPNRVLERTEVRPSIYGKKKSTSCYTRHLSSSGEDLKSSRNLRREMRREDVGRSTPDLEDNLQNIDLEGSFVTVVYCHIYIIVSKKNPNEIAPEDLKI